MDNNWRSGLFDELLHESNCARQSRKSIQGPIDEDQIMKVFTRLMFWGQVRAAARWITNRAPGGVLSSSDVDSSGKLVFDVLQEKHPAPGFTNDNAFVKCDVLPPMIDVDVTSGHVKCAARSLRGGAGPRRTSSSQWQDLFCYGAQSGRLRDAVAGFTRYVANNIISWLDIRIFMSSRLIALDKNPGVHPIGIGEVLIRILGKLMILITGIDVEEVCSVDQLCSGLKVGIEGAVHGLRDVM